MNHKKHRKRPRKYPKTMSLSLSAMRRLGNITKDRFKASTMRRLQKDG